MGYGYYSGRQVVAADAAATMPKIDITIQKYAGPAGACNASEIGKRLVNPWYTVPYNADWAYCYVISNPIGECLYEVTLKDPAPKGGIGTHNVTTVNQILCPGQTVYVPGPTKLFKDAPEALYRADAQGRGRETGREVSAYDSVAVAVAHPSTMKIGIQFTKYAGPAGACNASEVGKKLVNPWYTIPPNTDWAYCYMISNPNTTDECLTDVTLEDPAPKGGIGIRKVTPGGETLCPGQTVFIPGPTKLFEDAPEGYYDAEVYGYGYYTGRHTFTEDSVAVSLWR